MKKLFVGNLAWGTTDQSLQDLFSTVGNVVSANVIINKMTGRSKGFGFVEMSTEEEAERAKAELNEKELDGRNISVNDARAEERRDGDSTPFQAPESQPQEVQAEATQPEEVEAEAGQEETQDQTEEVATQPEEVQAEEAQPEDEAA